MIYLDTSVALAQLLVEDRSPPTSLWGESLVSSKLLEYEIWNRVNAKNIRELSGAAVRDLLERMYLLELTPAVLERALEPFPIQVRTLDALHLASMTYLRDQRQHVSLASYDNRLLKAAQALDFEVETL